MKQCPICGSMLAGEAEVCYNCQTKLADISDVEKEKVEYKNQTDQKDVVLKKETDELQVLEKIYADVHFMKTVAMVGIILIIIAFVVSFFAMLT